MNVISQYFISFHGYWLELNDLSQIRRFFDARSQNGTNIVIHPLHKFLQNGKTVIYISEAPHVGWDKYIKY